MLEQGLRWGLMGIDSRHGPPRSSVEKRPDHGAVHTAGPGSQPYIPRHGCEPPNPDHRNLASAPRPPSEGADESVHARRARPQNALPNEDPALACASRGRLRLPPGQRRRAVNGTSRRAGSSLDRAGTGAGHPGSANRIWRTRAGARGRHRRKPRPTAAAGALRQDRDLHATGPPPLGAYADRDPLRRGPDPLACDAAVDGAGLGTRLGRNAAPALRDHAGGPPPATDRGGLGRADRARALGAGRRRGPHVGGAARRRRAGTGRGVARRPPADGAGRASPPPRSR